MDDTPIICRLASDVSDVPKATERRSPDRRTRRTGRRDTAMRRMTGRSPGMGFEDAEYTPDEIQFMFAIDRYKRENGRPFPTWSEVLGVLRSLGYRKVRP